jgi:hypothetical protein
MTGSTTKPILFFQLSVDPILGDHDQLIFSPTPPIKRDSGQPIPIPTLQALSRDLCADGKWGSYLPHTSHHRVPLASEYPGLPSATLIRTASANRKTETNEGKTKMGFQNWATPPTFIEWCEREVLPTYGYSEFGLDACATPENCKAPRFLAPVESDLCMGPGCIGVNGLYASWANYGAVWCNPGFSACAQWLDKAASEAERGTTSVVLTHACHGARWFRTRLAKANAVWLINPRINFLPPEDVEPSSNNRDSYLWVFSGRCRPVQQFVYPNAWRS